MYTTVGATDGYIIGVFTVVTTENINMCLNDHIESCCKFCFGYVDPFVCAKHYNTYDAVGGGYPLGCSMVFPRTVGGTVS